MIKPKALKLGDVVGVVAPSDAVEKKPLERSADILKKWGLRVKYGRHVYAHVGDFMAGTPEERMEDLRTMIYDPEIKCVWAASGGYAATEVLPVFNREVIDFLSKNPKWFVGYSDVSTLLNALTSFKIVSITGPNLWGVPDWDKQSKNYLKSLLFGEKIDGIDPEANWRPQIEGVAEGRIVATGLEALIYTFGTRFDPIMYGGGGDIILVVEELDIEKCTLQRQIDMILNHKRATRIKGLVVGRMNNVIERSYPKWGNKLTPLEIIAMRVKRANIPMAYLDDFGHPSWDYGPLAQIKKYFTNRRFYSLPNGINCRLTVDDKSAHLQYLENATDI